MNIRSMKLSGATFGDREEKGKGKAFAKKVQTSLNLKK